MEVIDEEIEVNIQLKAQLRVANDEIVRMEITKLQRKLKCFGIEACQDIL